MEAYKYLMCGLDYIYLVNGYTVHQEDDEEYVSVDDILGLHKAIAEYIINNKPTLSHQDFRFLRKELNLSQVALGNLLGVSESVIRDYENDRRKVSIPTDRLMRAIYRNTDVRKFIERVSDIDKEIQSLLYVQHEDDTGWQAA